MTDTTTLDLSLPKPLGRGRHTSERRARYGAEVVEWCGAMIAKHLILFVCDGVTA
jgi:hypothetical protein